MAALAACGHAPAAAPVAWQPTLPRLLPPPPADPQAHGAAYLAQVALQLQPGWGQFLDDCRLRLPANHALNRLRLAATAELAIDASGQVASVVVTGSGNADFDQAVRDAIGDASPFPPPPPELLSDDDRVHLRWLFARDRRQAGPATAAVFDVELPLAQVVARRIAEHDLARAARRIARAPEGSSRTAAFHELMIAILREALGSADEAVRIVAVTTAGSARVHELAPDVRALISDTAPGALRQVATGAAASLGDQDALPAIARELVADVAASADLAAADVEALVALGAADQARAVLRERLDRPGSPDPVALALLDRVPIPELDAHLTGWLAHGDARTRTAVCAAASGASLEVAVRWLASGLADPDARVRARCAESAGELAARHAHDPRVAVLAPRLRRLAHDRDRSARGEGLAALVELDPTTAARAADDPAAEVRKAYAFALADLRAPVHELAGLVEDRDPDVRAAAWYALSSRGHADSVPDLPQLAARAALDPAAQVRKTVVLSLSDEAVLARLVAHDDDPGVQAEALARLCMLRGRARCEGDLLAEIASASPGSAERVRAALAWLLAH